MIAIIPMAHHNSTDSRGTCLELDPTQPSGLCSPTVTGPYRQVHSVLVCFISLLEQNLPENVCCYYYYYHHHHHHSPYWELNKGAIKKKTKKEKKATQTLSLTIINNSLMLIGMSDRSHCPIYEPKTIFKWGAFCMYDISILL